MVSAEVHLTVENAAPKKKQGQLHSLKLLSAKKKKNSWIQYLKRRNNFSLLLLLFTNKLLTLLIKKTSLVSDVAFIMNLKMYPYEGMTGCMYLILIYRVNKS